MGNSLENKYYDEEYNKIWDLIIQESINEHKNDFGLKTKINLKNRIGKQFNQQRDKFIKSFMVTEVCNIDRHKIAACIVKSILIVKPFYIPLKTKLKLIFTNRELYQLLDINPKLIKKSCINNLIYYINEYFALSIALSIIDSYISADDEKKIKHKIIIPDPFSDKDPDYLLDFCIDLHYNNIKRINIVTLANIFFLWEKYSCRRTQCDNFEKECKRLLLHYGECTSDNVNAKIDEIRFRIKNDTNTDISN